MDDLRLSDLLIPLSHVTDLGMGQPPGTATRCCVVAARLARLAGCDEVQVSDAFFTTLMQHLGCTAYAHETTRVFGGDDIALRAAGSLVDSTDPREALPFLFRINDGSPFTVRTRTVLKAIAMGSAFDAGLSHANCEVALRLAGRIGLEPGVQEGLDHIYERWDGKGHPRHLSGEAITLVARLTHVASQAVLFFDLGGMVLARETVRKRSGAWLDPHLAELFAAHVRELLTDLDDAEVAAHVAEPVPGPVVPWARMDAIARAFGDMVDVKSPFTHGHSSGVARLAEAAAGIMGLPGSDVTAIRRAAHLHDIGHVGTPNGILEKAGPLTSLEWECIRLHPYHAERILLRSGALARLAPLVGMHHERLDGSGYHHHAPGPAIPMGARIIAAANVYQAMGEERPYRPAHPQADAAAQLRLDVREGRLDGDAVEAVLAAAGHESIPVRPVWPAGLTWREVEILRLAARGLSNRQVAERLSISPKTVGHHIQHIYDKIGVSTRAGAAIFAMEHDLYRNVEMTE